MNNVILIETIDSVKDVKRESFLTLRGGWKLSTN